MRLIDADALLKSWRKSDKNMIVCCGDVADEIEDAPTVDAIPVDWIEGWTAATNSRELFLAMLYDWRRNIDPPTYVEPENDPAALKQHNNSGND